MKRQESPERNPSLPEHFPNPTERNPNPAEENPNFSERNPNRFLSAKRDFSRGCDDICATLRFWAMRGGAAQPDERRLADLQGRAGWDRRPWRGAISIAGFNCFKPLRRHFHRAPTDRAGPRDPGTGRALGPERRRLGESLRARTGPASLLVCRLHFPDEPDRMNFERFNSITRIADSQKEMSLRTQTPSSKAMAAQWLTHDGRTCESARRLTRKGVNIRSRNTSSRRRAGDT